MSDRIRLRAMALVWYDEDGTIRNIRAGIALPDDRFIFGGTQTYSSEKAMLRLNPTAVVQWLPSSDDVINYVMPDDTDANDS